MTVLGKSLHLDWHLIQTILLFLHHRFIDRVIDVMNIMEDTLRFFIEASLLDTKLLKLILA